MSVPGKTHLSYCGRRKRLSALQARRLGPRRDQPAKRAHPLRCVTANRWHNRRKQLGNGCGDEGEPSMKTIAQLTKSAFHRRSTFVFLPMHGRSRHEASGRSARGEKSPFPHLRQTHDDTPRLVILYKIAHTCTKRAIPWIAETGQSASTNRAGCRCRKGNGGGCAPDGSFVVASGNFGG
jgi:hypothetical protein